MMMVAPFRSLLSRAATLRQYDLPCFATWSKQVRNARKALGEQKYTKRGGRALGKSIVSAREIDYQRGDE
ncbi:MAG: hypothetical protein GXY83_10830 [Rhodopirellula sp.]|nr:hypothetical protein [Rhodopirellula sp.]